MENLRDKQGMMRKKYELVKFCIYDFLKAGRIKIDALIFGILLLLPAGKENNKSPHERVIFVIDSSSPRVIKILKELTDRGIEIISICRYRRNNLLTGEIATYSTKVAKYWSAQSALHKCRKYKGSVFHIFCCYEYNVPELLIKKNVGKIIFDNYDAFAGFVSTWNESNRNREIAAKERFCMENADGLTCRSFESQYNKKYMGWKFKGKRLLFLDYCAEPDISVKTDEFPKRKISFFYGGGMPNEEQEPKAPYSCMTDAINIIAKDENDFYVCGVGMTNDVKRHFEKIAKNNTRFHLKENVPYVEMKRILKKCDYNFLPTAEKFYLYMKSEINDGRYIGVKYKYSATNKIFDGFEAGIPFVGCAPYILCKLLSRYGMVYYCTMEMLKEELPKLKSANARYRNNVRLHINKFAMKNNIGRLINFYMDIYQK